MARQLRLPCRRRFSCKHPGYTLKDVTFWAQLTGDTNPIHTDSRVAKAAGEAARSCSAMFTFGKGQRLSSITSGVALRHLKPAGLGRPVRRRPH